MGDYYNPPREIEEVGRRLEPKESFAEMAAQLEPGELLFGLYDINREAAPLRIVGFAPGRVPVDEVIPAEGHHLACPHIPNQSEWDDFQGDHATLLGYFAVTELPAIRGVRGALSEQEGVKRD